jgi:tRNA modification GTPase
MSVLAAVMTGRGMGAIATVQLFGDAAPAVLQATFQRKGGRPFESRDGRILLGGMVDEDQIIDEVTIGCEGPHTFAIHCHGNPLIVERIVELLRRQGVQIVPAEQLLARILTSREARDNAIGIEARLALATVKTIAGAAIVANQVTAGLSEKIRYWRDRLDSLAFEKIAGEAQDILERSETARLIVFGCTIALIGPPNSGKSTLLNTLAGREKAIVSDIRGTTRDWVSAEIHIPPLAATIIDTAGLDASIGGSRDVDQAAQRKSFEIAQRADLVLLVLDLSQPAGQLPESVPEQLVGRRVVTVLNKADLPPRLDITCVPDASGPTVPVSAKQGRGIDGLIQAIHHACGVVDFDPRTAVVFTDRQSRLLDALQHGGTKTEMRSILSKLREDSPPL